MNRRSFITSALAGLPLIGKLVQAQPPASLPPVYTGPIDYDEVKYVVGRWPFGFARGPIDRVEAVYIDHAKVYDRALSKQEVARIYINNPRTGKPWTEADINSAEFGKLISSASS
jgi:hypothetical protein